MKIASSVIAGGGRLARRLAARRARTFASAAAASSSSDGPGKFDAEMVELYSKMANQHFHPKGPWPMMREKVDSMLREREIELLLKEQPEHEA